MRLHALAKGLRERCRVRANPRQFLDELDSYLQVVGLTLWRR